jgi:outer membrane murein-binding lipoprotein Lpp
MYGDELSTDAQVLNTKLTQITQNYNSFLSIATQLAKSTGEYFKSIASNVR